MILSPDFFFDLELFSHKKVFLLGIPVWETLKNLKKYLRSLDLGKIECQSPAGVTFINREAISIGKGTIIESGVFIKGPCVIGENCEIRQGAYIRENVLTGNQCIIGHATEVKHSIFLNNSKASHFNYVGNSILGNHVNIGAGVVCANFRLDQKDVVVKVEKDIYKTGMNKFGGVLGDGSQIGCNSVINPGVLLRKKSYSLSCISIQKSNIRKTKNV